MKEIRKMEVVRLDVVEEDELMAYSQGPKVRWSGSRSLGQSSDLYTKATEKTDRDFLLEENRTVMKKRGNNTEDDDDNNNNKNVNLNDGYLMLEEYEHYSSVSYLSE